MVDLLERFLSSEEDEESALSIIQSGGVVAFDTSAGVDYNLHVTIYKGDYVALNHFDRPEDPMQVMCPDNERTVKMWDSRHEFKQIEYEESWFSELDSHVVPKPRTNELFGELEDYAYLDRVHAMQSSEKLIVTSDTVIDSVGFQKHLVEEVDITKYGYSIVSVKETRSRNNESDYGDRKHVTNVVIQPTRQLFNRSEN